MDLIRLIYVSRVARSVRLEDAEAIARDSATRNERLEITGFLLYTPEYFFQALEGVPSVVQTLLARIERDDRHSDVQLLSRAVVPERVFPRWNMGFRFLPGPPAHAADGGFDATAVLRLLESSAEAPPPP